METKFIVVPVDFTPVTANALKYGIEMAADTGQEILALHIMKNQRERIEKEGMLKEFIGKAEVPSGVTITRRVIEGELDNDITKTAEVLGATVVVLGMHNPTFLKNVMVSNTISVLRHSKVPFLVIQEYSSYQPIRKIAVTIDLHKESVQVVRHAAVLARMFDAEVQLIGARQSDLDCAKRGDINMEIAKDYLNKKGVSNTGLLIMKEDFPKRLIEYCHENNVDIIAATYHPETFAVFSSKFVQNLMQNVFRIPVLTIENEEVEAGSMFGIGV